MICRQNTAAVLEKNGITKEDFIGWLEDGELAEYIRRTAKYSAMAKIPEVWFSLKKLADSGDIRAIKLYADLCDKVLTAEGTAGGWQTPDNPEVNAVRRELFGDGE